MMPRMDGTGACHEGRRMHGEMGGEHHHGQGGHCEPGRGQGFHGDSHPMHDGCRCGHGPCAQDDRQSLEARRDALKQSLADVEKRLETL
jgi:hypothetical protein